jgi:hypothetical protein
MTGSATTSRSSIAPSAVIAWRSRLLPITQSMRPSAQCTRPAARPSASARTTDPAAVDRAEQLRRHRCTACLVLSVTVRSEGLRRVPLPLRMERRSRRQRLNFARPRTAQACNVRCHGIASSAYNPGDRPHCSVAGLAAVIVAILGVATWMADIMIVGSLATVVHRDRRVRVESLVADALRAAAHARGAAAIGRTATMVT